MDDLPMRSLARFRGRFGPSSSILRRALAVTHEDMAVLCGEMLTDGIFKVGFGVLSHVSDRMRTSSYRNRESTESRRPVQGFAI